jgi:hypothetical protein
MFEEDLTGKRYGKLIVTRFLYSNRVQHANGFHTDTYWECKCDCGNIHKVLTRMLNSGSVKSCGCLSSGRRATPEGVFNELYNRYVCSARNKNLEFSLTKEKFREITKQDCYYCGTEPKQIARKDREYPYIYNGIDRIDNTKGYKDDNIVPCCGICNKMKLEMSIAEFKERTLTITKHMNW